MDPTLFQNNVSFPQFPSLPHLFFFSLPFSLSIINTYRHFHLFSLLFSGRAGSVSDSIQRPSRLRTNSEDHGSFKTKDQAPNPDKDKAARKKSTDSGEEADKDFILIWVRQIYRKNLSTSLKCFPLEKQLRGNMIKMFSVIFEVVPVGPVWPQSTNHVWFAGWPAVVSGNTLFQIKVSLVIYDKTTDIDTWGEYPQ